MSDSDPSPPDDDPDPDAEPDDADPFASLDPDLREKTDVGDRTDSAPASAESADDGGEADAVEQSPHEAFAAAVETHLDAIAAGEKGDTIGVRDPELAAFLRALNDVPSIRTDVGLAVQAAYGTPPDPTGVDKSTIVRLAVRAALAEYDPETFATFRDVLTDRARVIVTITP
ncbi:hypothetical protein [Halomarina pelagica]|uniref:hypothetical protein n=1 Tax=Halomarina pelagica TaxID=2961599 RepID=UPI0020C4A2EE|nr:hypothetical protein [Halomarina sp. BND7]